MRRIYITAFIYVMAYSGLAQGKPADSLTAKMPATTDLREKYRLLDQISSNYYKLGTIQNPLDNSLEMIRIALQLRDDSLIAKSYNVLGDYYTFIKGDNNTALE